MTSSVRLFDPPVDLTGSAIENRQFRQDSFPTHEEAFEQIARYPCVGGLGMAGMSDADHHGSAAQASADIPLNHWAYEAVERLWALDLIDRAMLVQKPYSRMQAAKYVARAVERIRG